MDFLPLSRFIGFERVLNAVRTSTGIDTRIYVYFSCEELSHGAACNFAEIMRSRAKFCAYGPFITTRRRGVINLTGNNVS